MKKEQIINVLLHLPNDVEVSFNCDGEWHKSANLACTDDAVEDLSYGNSVLRYTNYYLIDYIAIR
jgi:hypothetical protein